jgi:hypothetical protein
MKLVPRARPGSLALIGALLGAMVSLAARAEEGKNKKLFFPLPLYTTVPNEGSTYGAMPVIIAITPAEQVRWILAPSLSWNRAAGWNGTFRYYRFPRREEAWSVIAAASTHINRSLWLTYNYWGPRPFTPTIESLGQARRNLFFRFFGLGPDSEKSAESSYTRTTALLSTRVGFNLPGNLNLGVRVLGRRDWILEHAIFGLPTLQEAHPEAPGLGGAALATVGASLRYDTRAGDPTANGGDYAARGVAAELAASRSFGLKATDSFWRLTAQARALVREASFIQGAARVYWSELEGGDTRNIPFYYQPSLGGEVLLRGYPDDRFIDRGAWEAEIEQRFRVLQTHFFHVTTDWRVDPFVVAGQVYHRHADMFDRPRVALGVGLRAFVRPNVLGRVDVAWSGEGLRAYVVLGYPY